jgi:hypothetical protein
LKFLTSMLFPVLMFVGCKTNSSTNNSNVLVASDPNKAMSAISSEQDFCVQTEEEGAKTCEKVLLDFMNSPKFKGQELIITCSGGSIGFVNSGVVDADLKERLSILFGNPNTNNNHPVALERRCGFKKGVGVREG